MPSASREPRTRNSAPSASSRVSRRAACRVGVAANGPRLAPVERFCLWSFCLRVWTMAAVEARRQFAQNLRAQREKQGLSQEALAFACELHRTEISLLERAGRDPRLSTIVRLARGLEV